jgi:anti-anti-sigma regulatory factor
LTAPFKKISQRRFSIRVFEGVRFIDFYPGKFPALLTQLITQVREFLLFFQQFLADSEPFVTGDDFMMVHFKPPTGVRLTLTIATFILKLRKPLVCSAVCQVRHHASTSGYEIMLLDLSDVPTVDFTTTGVFVDIIVDTYSAGRKIYLLGTRDVVLLMLKKQRVTRHLQPDCMIDTRIKALQDAEAFLKSGQPVNCLIKPEWEFCLEGRILMRIFRQEI